MSTGKELIRTHITAPQLADQSRFIIRNKIFRETELEEIQKKKYDDERPQNNSTTVEETQITIANIKEITNMNYTDDNLEEVIRTESVQPTLKQPMN